MSEIWVTAADMSLYHVAARELGDACQWWRIAEANGLSDPDLGWIAMPLKLALPQGTLEAGSGVSSVST